MKQKYLLSLAFVLSAIAFLVYLSTAIYNHFFYLTPIAEQYSSNSTGTLWFLEENSLVPTFPIPLINSSTNNYLFISCLQVNECWMYSNGNIYKNNKRIYSHISGKVKKIEPYLVSDNKIFYTGESVELLPEIKSSEFRNYKLDYFRTDSHLIHQNMVSEIDFSRLVLFQNGTLKDANSVYVNHVKMEASDPTTFVPVIEPYYYKDDLRVYFAPKPGVIPGASSANFTVFTENPRYSKDRSNVYYTPALSKYFFPQKIDSADAETFNLVLGETKDGQAFDAIDKKSLYLYGKIVGEKQ